MSKLNIEERRKNFSASQASEVYERQNGLCDKCKKPHHLYQLNRHHRDGVKSNDNTDNLQLLCTPCHQQEPFGPNDKRRENTHRITFYLPNETYQKMSSYISHNYSASSAYGAVSKTVTDAIDNYCVIGYDYSLLKDEEENEKDEDN